MTRKEKFPATRMGDGELSELVRPLGPRALLRPGRPRRVAVVRRLVPDARGVVADTRRVVAVAVLLALALAGRGRRLALDGVRRRPPVRSFLAVGRRLLVRRLGQDRGPGVAVVLLLIPGRRRRAVALLLLLLVLVVLVAAAGGLPVGPRVAVRRGSGARGQREAEQADRDSRGGKNGRRCLLHLSPS